MAQRNLPEKVKLIAGLIAGNTELFLNIRRPLERALKNTIDFDSETINFIYTDYYRKEMGQDLKRRFLSFKNNMSLEKIYETKIKTNELERLFSKSGKRTINIDPGYIDLSKLVLFSTKDYTHRVHLSKGIYAEVTLYYKDRTFNPWPWTYPDYKTKKYIDIFNNLRQVYSKGIG